MQTYEAPKQLGDEFLSLGTHVRDHYARAVSWMRQAELTAACALCAALEDEENQ